MEVIVYKMLMSVRRELECDIEKMLKEFYKDVLGFLIFCVLLIRLGSILVDYENIEVKM